MLGTAVDFQILMLGFLMFTMCAKWLAGVNITV